jgi:hypothetical protein
MAEGRICPVGRVGDGETASTGVEASASVETSTEDKGAVATLSVVGIAVGVSTVGDGDTPQAERSRVKRSKTDKKIGT